MTIETHAPNRKVLAQALAEHLHEPAHYLGTPTYAYKVGTYIIDRNGALHGDDIEPLREFLLSCGYITEDTTVTDTTMTDTAAQPDSEATDEATADAEDAEDAADTTDESNASDKSDEIADDDHEIEDGKCEVVINLLLNDTTPQQLANFLRMLYARQDLIAAMTGSTKLRLEEEVITLLNELKPDSLEKISKLLADETAVGMASGIELQGEKLMVTISANIHDDRIWAYYVQLMQRALAVAKLARHVNTNRITPTGTETKYCCHAWLMQLQMGGEAFKAQRQELLGHLQGYAAFRTADRMAAHKEKCKQRRAARKNKADEDDEASEAEEE